jgi:hypothetical protein
MATTDDWTTRVTGLTKVRYLGSHPAVAGQIEKLDCGFHPAGVWARPRRQQGIRIPWSNVRRMEAPTTAAPRRRRLPHSGAGMREACRADRVRAAPRTDEGGEPRA